MHTKLILLITLICSSSVLVFSFESVPLIFGTALVISITCIVVFLLNNLRIRLLIVWHVAFFYIIGFEGLLHSDELLLNYGLGIIKASQYLVFTFLITNVGYLFLFIIKKNKTISKEINSSKAITHIYYPTISTYILLILAYLVYLLLNLESTLIAISSGRIIEENEGNLGFIYSIVNSVCSTVLPAVIAFTFKYMHKYKHYIVMSIITSLPIILILFLQGTRFTLLFSIAGLTLVLLGNVKINIKNIIILLTVGILLIFSSEIMLESRGQGIASYLESSDKQLLESFQEVFYSREGVIKANTWLIEYYDENPHKYGLSSSFIFFFWIPRFIWPEKPTMLGHWLIREVQIGGYGEGHSVSYGFAGDAYADFGFVGGMFFSLILGGFFFILDRINKKIVRSQFNILYVAITIPFTFFALRSFQTAFMSLVGMALFLWIFKMTLKIINNELIEFKSKENQ